MSARKTTKFPRIKREEEEEAKRPRARTKEREEKEEERRFEAREEPATLMPEEVRLIEGRFRFYDEDMNTSFEDLLNDPKRGSIK